MNVGDYLVRPSYQRCSTILTDYLVFSQELYQRRNMPASSEDRYLNSYPMRYQGYHQDRGTATKNYQGLQDHNQDWQAVCPSYPSHTIQRKREWKLPNCTGLIDNQYHSANYHRYRDVNQDRHNCFD